MMKTEGRKARKNLSIATALLVGIPLFVTPTFVQNGYDLFTLFLAMIIIYGVAILYVAVMWYKYDVREDKNRSIEQRDI